MSGREAYEWKGRVGFLVNGLLKNQPDYTTERLNDYFSAIESDSKLKGMFITVFICLLQGKKAEMNRSLASSNLFLVETVNNSWSAMFKEPKVVQFILTELKDIFLDHIDSSLNPNIQEVTGYNLEACFYAELFNMNTLEDLIEAYAPKKCYKNLEANNLIYPCILKENTIDYAYIPSATDRNKAINDTFFLGVVIQPDQNFGPDLYVQYRETLLSFQLKTGKLSAIKFAIAINSTGKCFYRHNAPLNRCTCKVYCDNLAKCKNPVEYDTIYRIIVSSHIHSEYIWWFNKLNEVSAHMNEGVREIFVLLSAKKYYNFDRYKESIEQVDNYDEPEYINENYVRAFMCVNRYTGKPFPWLLHWTDKCNMRPLGLNIPKPLITFERCEEENYLDITSNCNKEQIFLRVHYQDGSITHWYFKNNDEYIPLEDLNEENNFTKLHTKEIVRYMEAYEFLIVGGYCDDINLCNTLDQKKQR